MFWLSCFPWMEMQNQFYSIKQKKLYNCVVTIFENQWIISRALTYVMDIESHLGCDSTLRCFQTSNAVTEHFKHNAASNLTLKLKHDTMLFIGSLLTFLLVDIESTFDHLHRNLSIKLRKKSSFLQGWVSKSGKCCHTWMRQLLRQWINA